MFSFNLNASCKFKNTTSNDEVKYTTQKSINVDDIECNKDFQNRNKSQKI